MWHLSWDLKDKQELARLKEIGNKAYQIQGIAWTKAQRKEQPSELQLVPYDWSVSDKWVERDEAGEESTCTPCQNLESSIPFPFSEPLSHLTPGKLWCFKTYHSVKSSQILPGIFKVRCLMTLKDGGFWTASTSAKGIQELEFGK